MLTAACEFHELPKEVKEEYYSKEEKRKVNFRSNFDLIAFVLQDVTMEYSEKIEALGNILFELLSKSLGLKAEHLKSMDCAKRHCLLSHYCPPCLSLNSPWAPPNTQILTSSPFFFKTILVDFKFCCTISGLMFLLYLELSL
ncbi:hypothetical protein K1719_036310 [Acacia pycnantha]|nr:hypothetical protein K1719_036310 [Acacia pycnantha]